MGQQGRIRRPGGDVTGHTPSQAGSVMLRYYFSLLPGTSSNAPVEIEKPLRVLEQTCWGSFGRCKMTWVCAVSSVMGYGAIYSDVQVTLRNGSTRDLVQKAYPITNSIAAGFAGSVRIGFSLLDSLTSFLRLPPDVDPNQIGWDPRWISANWAPFAKSVFDKADASERRLGSKLLIVAASPNENCGIETKVYFTRFSAPDFRPGIMSKPFKFCSIGSGAAITEYHDQLKPLFRWSGHISTLKAEVGQPYGWARNLSFRISRCLADHPRPGISRHMHMIIVGRRTIVVENNDENIYVGDAPRIEIRMPSVAQSYQQFTAFAAAGGHDAVGATC